MDQKDVEYMGEARSRAHYRMVWEEEIKRLNTLGWSITGEDMKRVKEIQDELREIVKRGAQEVKKPEVCPQCADTDEAGKVFFCAYRKDCPDNHLTIPKEVEP